MKFELTEDQMNKVKVWQEAIHTIFGEYGLYTYCFKPTGIGDIITVQCNLVPNKELDLTDVETW